MLVCSLSLAAHILATSTAVKKHDVGALLAVQLGVVGLVCLAIGGLAGDLEAPEGGTVWSALIMAAIVAVEIIPRFRPPRPLPEG